jgi:hypothetical protein
VAEAMRFATRGGKAPEGVLPRGQMAELWRWEGLYRHLTHDLPGALVAYDKARRAGLGWSRGGACRGSRASRARSPPLPTRNSNRQRARACNGERVVVSHGFVMANSRAPKR